MMYMCQELIRKAYAGTSIKFTQQRQLKDSVSTN